MINTEKTFLKRANKQPTPGYNTAIPAEIMTPDRVETSIGTLEFVDISPTKETAELVYGNLDFLRGVETCLNGIPAAWVEGLWPGAAGIGATECYQVIVFSNLMNSNLWLTGNIDTVYSMIFLDL